MKLKHLLLLLLFIPGLTGFHNPLSACELWELVVQKSNCDNDNKFSVTINFNYKDASNCFTITGNGVNYGTFEYSQLPLTISNLSGDCHTEYEFQMTDCNNKDCHVSKVLGTVCCGQCLISNLKLEKTTCDSNNKFFVFLNFSHENTSHCFHLKINDVFYGDFEYASLPVKIGPLEGDCTTNRVFSVYDCDKPDACNAKIGMDKVCCNHDCKISNVKIEKTDCDSLNMFTAIISFKAENVSDSFILKIGDKSYGKFKYGNQAYKIGPLPGDCHTKFKFIIIDNKNTQCATDTLWGPVCCGTPPEPCHLTDLEISKTDCNSDNQFSVRINFKHNNSSDWFKIFKAGVYYGDFKYADLPLIIGPFLGDCTTEYDFLIKDSDNPDCRLEYNFGHVCCGTEPCKLREFDVIKSDCDSDNHFYVNINFINQHSSECFNLYVNNDLYGNYKYADLPLLRVGPFNGDCHTEYVFLVQDCTNHDCRIDKSIGTVCCNPPDPCKLGELEIAKSDCDSNNNFFVNINLINNNSSECFNLFVNNDLYGIYKYSDLPLLRVGPFHGDCQTEYVFHIQDCANHDCHVDKSIGKVCCGTPPPPCKISNLIAEKSPCTDQHQFFLTVNFDHNHKDGCFNLFTNGGVPYGQFPYSSLPLKIGPFPGDCHTNYSLVVRDCTDPNCAADKNIGVVCCDTTPPCHLYDLNVERSDCDSNNQFYVRFNFKSSNSSTCFRIKGNGHDYGMHNYADLPLQLGPFNGDCTTNYEFVIFDCNNERCSLENNLGIVCCGTHPPPCKLSELKLEKSDCGGDKQFYVTINFNHDGNSDCFHVTGNGHSYGEFKYGQLPIKIGPLLGDCVTNYEFGIEDCTKQDCHISGNIGVVCCDTTNSKYYDVEMTRTDCEPDSTFKVKFNFHYRGVSDSFNIFINGKSYGTFGYNQLPVSAGPLKADCKTIYKINLIDQLDTTIRLERFIERPCCHPAQAECKIYDVKASPQNCTGPGEYTLLLSFHHKGTTNQYYDVFDRNGPIGTFAFAPSHNDTVTLEHFKKSGHEFDYVKICENDNTSCCAAVEFRTITCDSVTNGPNKFNLSGLIVNTIGSSNLISIFSEVEIPGDLEIEMFNLEGRQVPIDNVIRQLHEIFISSSLLTTDMYFIRLKSQANTKTYKFFLIR